MPLADEVLCWNAIEREYSMRKVFKYFDQALLVVLALIAIAMVIIGFMQVFFRHVLRSPLSWSEECIRYLFVWTTFLGTPIGIKRNGHASFDILGKKLPDKYQQPYRTMLYLLAILMFTVFIAVGFPFSIKNMSQLTPATKIPYGLVSLSVPVGGIIGILYCVDGIIGLFQTGKEDTA